MKSFRFLISFGPLFLASVFSVNGQRFEIHHIGTNTTSHFRALSVVDDRVAWVSGSQGTFGKTINGGTTWKFRPIKNFEKLEFRALFAFDSLRAVIANAGAPAYVLYTKDGGENWSVAYTNEHKDAFIDGMDFWNANEGMVYGDAIDGRMLLLRSHDGGMSWNELPFDERPALKEGEGSFAASGTGIRCMGDQDVLIATGGKTSRLWISDDRGARWAVFNPPILQGETMTGIFSVAFRDSLHWIIVGGNYEKDTLKTDHVFYTQDGGNQWMRPAIPTRGLRECVEFISGDTVVSSGPKGIDLSYDKGKNWQPLSDDRQFSVIRKARRGSLIVLAGAKGKVAVLRQLP